MTEASGHSALVTIRNEKGLHARASAKFVTRDDQRVGGTSIMGLLMLAAGPGVTLLLEASGRQAEEALAALSELVNDGFGEGCIDQC